MSDILSQDEVDHLLTSIDRGESTPGRSAPPEAFRPR
jgi:flagellar motor switch protein FliM